MPPPFRFQPRVLELDAAAGELSAVELAARLSGARVSAGSAGDGTLALLDGWPRGTSVVAFDPLPARLPRGLVGLRRLVATLAPGAGDAVPGAFHGGFVGALAYELGAAAERGLALPRDPWRLPPVMGGLFTDFVVRLDAERRAFLVLGEAPGDGRRRVSARAAEVRRRLARPATIVDAVPRGPLRRLVSPREHARRVRRVRALIAAGEIYQANLSHRLSRAVRGDPLALYRRLVALHPAPHAAFLRTRRAALLSASPELLLEFVPSRGGARACTRPIKGTAARDADPVLDRAAAAALLASEKDLSELAMIVDLERNDLGRIAVPGGVEVAGFPTLESYASVHHLVADVVARVRPDVDAVACLASLFPGGSVTGAPKLRSMEAIAELEGEGRGFAYGAMVALDLRGALTASLLIRTLVWRPRGPAGASDGEVTFRVGGGITWGSDPAAEEAEAAAKGVLLARALDAPSAAAAPRA